MPIVVWVENMQFSNLIDSVEFYILSWTSCSFSVEEKNK